MSVFLEQAVDVLKIIERVIEEELELRNDAELMTLQLAHLIAYLGCVVVDVLQDVLCFLRWEDTEVGFRHTQVGTDSHHTYAHENAPCLTRLCLKDVAQVLLNQTCDFILSCCFQYL